MNKKWIWIAVVLVVLYISMGQIAEFYVDLTWFKINSGGSVFWTYFLTKFKVQLIFGLIFAAMFLFNFLLIRLLGGKGRIFTANILDRLQIPVLGSPRKALAILLVLTVVGISLFMANASSAYWKEYLMFTNSVPFGDYGFKVDPIFKMDVGFYVFSLPFYQFLYGWFMSSLIIIALFSVMFHILNRGIFMTNNSVEFSLFARSHISILLAAIVLLYGIGYRISAFELLFTESGKFFGAGYTAHNAKLVAFNVAMVIAIIGAILLLFNIFKRSFLLPIGVLATIIPAFFVLGTVYPAIQQRFVVDPNELDKERPYIKNNIEFTRIAYRLNNIKEQTFANKQTLTYKQIQKNRNTLDNVRLWDWRPLKPTYKQLQALRPYYKFMNVDVDRYLINNKKVAVNISARELNVNSLDPNSRTWQNQHLIFTHGYGSVMSRVDRATAEGLPVLLLSDFPPKTKIKELEVKRPEIYYGEHNNKYIITNTSQNEFDYPSGKKMAFTKYKGSGGIKLDSFMKRLFFALHYKDMNILISNNITDKSRILFRRNIINLANKLTPFLAIDRDPYMVISKGKQYWIIDAYTTSDQFPYSKRMRISRRKSINYIRNSVKIVVDAYNGTISYYISDKKDPMIQAYQKIFTNLFKPIESMPKDLQKHIKYPSTIFDIQCKLLLRYHMTSPDIFYKNEDLWQLPKQVYDQSEETMSSYYLVTRLPDEKTDEFILIMPFTPDKKNNMLAFMVAKCDTPGYGELKLYTLPKDKLSYGPLQIEGRINQDPEISKQLTLWNQKGSRVIKGNMLAIPIEDSLIFIEPLYLKADSSEMPELKRVIVSFNNKIVMEKDLSTALERLFYKGGTSFIPSNDITSKPGENVKNLASRALTHYNRAQKLLKAGDWAGYGRELKTLENILKAMKDSK